MIMIYISEAHANDVWPIGESTGVINNKHQTVQDRVDCATRFKEEYDFNIPMYVDNMNDEFENVTSAWPFRYFVTKGSEIVFIAKPEDSSFDILKIYDIIK